MSDHIRNVIEAALLAAGRPMPLNELSELFDEDGRPQKPQLQGALEELSGLYAERAIELKETASGWRVQIRQNYAREISRLWPERPQKYSRALLETLALIAYRQPITRAEIESVRGVAVNPNIVKTLMEREWVRVVGHRDVPGRPELLGTTKSFLDYFGLRSIDELPPLAELKAMADLNPQLTLPVSEEGSIVAAPEPPEPPELLEPQEPEEPQELQEASDPGDPAPAAAPSVPTVEAAADDSAARSVDVSAESIDAAN